MKRFILVLSIIVLSLTTLRAQWTRLPGPWGGYAQQYVATDSGILACTANELYRSTDNGHHWTKQNIWLPPDILDFQILYQHGQTWLIQARLRNTGNTSHVYLSNDGAVSFSQLLDSCAQCSVAALGNTLYLATTPMGQLDRRTLLRSDDGGMRWTDQSPASVTGIRKLISFGNRLYCVIETNRVLWQLSKSADGQTWDSLIGMPSPDRTHGDVGLLDYALYANGSDTSIWISTDSIDNYPNHVPHVSRLSTLDDSVHIMPFPTLGSSVSKDTTVYTFVVTDGVLYANTTDQIYEYYPGVDGWQPTTLKIPRYSVDRIVVFFPIPSTSPTEFLLSFDRWSRWNSGFTNGVYRSTAFQPECTPSDTGMLATASQQILAVGDSLYAVTAANGYPLYRSVDHGLHWSGVELPFDIHGYDIRAIGTSPKGLLYTNRDTSVLLTSDSSLRSGPGKQVIAFAHLADTILCAASGGIFGSTDSGVSWQYLSTPPRQRLTPSNITIQGHRVFVAGDSLMYSDDGCRNWTAVSHEPHPAFYILCLASNDSAVFMGVLVGDSTDSYGMVFRSSDRGLTWLAISPRLSSSIETMTIVGDRVFYGGDGIFASYTDGSRWRSLTATNPIPSIYSLTADSTYLYAATTGSGIYRAALNDLLNQMSTASDGSNAVSNSTLSLYPNPANSFVEIRASGIISEIRISDILGRTIDLPRSQCKINGDHALLDIHQLPAGRYLCGVTTRGGCFVAGFVHR